MLIVTGIIEVAPEGIDAARAATQTMMTETLKEQGCIVYEFSQVVGAETRFRVYEEWTGTDALRAHGAAPHMAEFRAALAKAGIVSSDISKVENGQKSSLG